MIYAVVNTKGGVGKTTTAVHLATMLLSLRSRGSLCQWAGVVLYPPNLCRRLTRVAGRRTGTRVLATRVAGTTGVCRTDAQNR